LLSSQILENQFAEFPTRFVVFERTKINADTPNSKVREENSPTYCRLLARMTPLIIGPKTCPTSIVVLRKPMEAPTLLDGVNSIIKGTVDEITIAKPSP